MTAWRIRVELLVDGQQVSRWLGPADWTGIRPRVDDPAAAEVMDRRTAAAADTEYRRGYMWRPDHIDVVMEPVPPDTGDPADTDGVT